MGDEAVWITIRDAGARAGVSERTIRNWIREGLPAARVGRRLIRIRSDHLDEWMTRAPARKTPANVVDLAREIRARAERSR